MSLDLVTLLIAAFVAYVGFEQLRTNRDRLKRELFDMRLEPYKAVLTLLGRGGFHFRTFDDEWLAEFRTMTLSSKFLLEPPVVDLLKTLDLNTQELLAINDELADVTEVNRKEELLHRRRELASWFRIQYSCVDEIFSSSLNLRKATKYF